MNKNILYIILFAIAMAVVAALIVMGDSNESEIATTENQPEAEAAMEAPMGSDFVDELTTTGMSPLEVTYDHTNPGEYSEVYVSFNAANPGEDVEVQLISPSDEKTVRIVTADENGNVFETFRIYNFGYYHARVIPSVSRTQFNSGVTVE